MDFLHTACPAKLNLALSVGAPDPETGMHPIASWMVALQLTDQLNVARGEGDLNDSELIDTLRAEHGTGRSAKS